MSVDKLHILCCHGRRQNGNIFERRLETTIRRLRTQSSLEFEWTFLDAPFLCDGNSSDSGQRTWWQDSSNSTTYPTDLQVSLQLLTDALDATSFHVILSFSQGCSLVAEAAARGLFTDHSSLCCLVFAGGLLPRYFIQPKEPLLPTVSTLHFAGSKDEAVPMASSQSLAHVFANRTFIQHLQGHCFPSRSSESQTLIQFLEEKYRAASFAPSEDLLDELEALESIFTPEEYSVVDPVTKQLSVKVKSEQKTIECMFRFQTGYPEEAPLTLTTGDLIGCTKRMVTGALNMARVSIEENEGMPQVFAVVQAVQDFMDEYNAEGEEEEEEEEEEVQKEGTSKDPNGLKKRPTLNASNGAISVDVLSTLTEEASVRVTSSDAPRRRKKMYWGDFCIGLVGKPSAGKSTFFNACKTHGTNAARVGGFPFTTIEPNVGRAAVRFYWPTVIQTDTDNRMFELDVFIKDVAGLVKGAYQGRGRGNKFLDDLCGADVLVHVLDGSGDTDEEGNSSSGMGNPENEIAWVYAEIHRWISDNVLTKWHMVVRKNTRDAIGSLFTGYRNVKEDVDRSAALAGLQIEDNKAKEGRKDFIEWTKEDVHRLVGFFLRLRFPILIGFNKCDDERSVAHLKTVRHKYKHEIVVPMSAMVENILLSRMAGKRRVGGGVGKGGKGGKEEQEQEKKGNNVPNASHGGGRSSDIRIEMPNTTPAAQIELEDAMISKCFRMLGQQTGVRDCVDKAVSLQRPVVIYVVRIALKTSSNITLVPGDVVPLLFRRGVTPYDVYRHLLHTDNAAIRLSGDFVRSEYISMSGVRTVIKKQKTINAEEECVLKIYVAKTSNWQKNGGGGAGPGGGGATTKKKSSHSSKGGGDSGESGESGGGRAEKRLASRNKLIKKLHKSADRQGKNKGNKGTGQDRRTLGT